MKTPLFEEHTKLKGKIVDFAGWELPVMYSSIIEEHNAVRNRVGLFDVSHMGEVIVQGNGAEQFLRSLIPTTMDKLKLNMGMYSCFCNEQGGVIDDLFIFKMAEDDFYLVVNASTKDKDLKWMLNHKISTDSFTITDVSSETAKIDIQGQLSKQILEKIFLDYDISEINRFFFKKFSYKKSEIIISNTGYTGELGYELFMDNEFAPEIWQKILKAGKEFGILPAGLGARDTLRLESCYSLYGHEINDEISPVEAGLSWLISSSDDYIAKNILENQKKNGVKRKQIAIELLDRGVLREGYSILLNNKKIGYITSGIFSPTFKKGLALALVDELSIRIGDKIQIQIRNRKLDAIVVKKPFYNYNG